MEHMRLDCDRFRTRIQRLISVWTWPLDALLLVTGKASDDSMVHMHKAAAMHHWLLGIEFPETAMALLKNGHVLFLASAKKVEYLRQVEGPDVSFLARAAAPDADADRRQFEEFMARIRGQNEQVTVGMLLEGKHVGSFADAFMKVVPSLGGVNVVECRNEISALLAPKDDIEIAHVKQSSRFAQLMMQYIFVRKLEEIIDRDIQQSNRDVCKVVEGEMDSDALMSSWQKSYNLEPGELDLLYVSLQSGKHFDLKPATEPTDDLIPMQGTYLLSLGMKYSEYSSCLTRTLLVDPVPRQKDAYNLALEVQKAVIDSLKPDASFKDIYLEARAVVERRKVDLVDRFVRSVGFVMGLEFRDPQYVLSEKSDRKVAAGMVFCVSVGFSDTAGGIRNGPWGVWLCDTVVVPVGGGECDVLTSACSNKINDYMYELDESVGAGAEPAAAEAAAPKAAAVAAPAAAAPPPQLPVTDAGKKPPADKPPGGKKAKAEPPVAAAAAPAAAAAKKKHQQQPERKPEKKPPPAAPAPSARPATKAGDRDRPADAAKKPLVGDPKKIMQTRLRGRNDQTKRDMNAKVQMEEVQADLRAQKLAELRARFGGKAARGDSDPLGGNRKLAECKAYGSPDDLPQDVRPNRLQVDADAQALLVPINGAVVPFHVGTIKNMSRSSVEKVQFLRVNFFVPGQGKGADDFPEGTRMFIKELSFRSESKDNFDNIIRNFKEAQRRMKHQEIEGQAKSKSSAAPPQALQTNRACPCIRDLNMKPTTGVVRRSTGNLEAHTNGFRFSSRGGAEKVDILYSQVQHAIFEPCESGSLVVILHLHLKEQIMVAKRKTQDFQFYTEVAPQTEDLSQKRAGSAYDPDEILEEQRERELKERLNKIFHDFTKKVQEIKTCPLEFDMPIKEFAFSGVPNKSTLSLYPCSRVLVGLQEWPPFCLDLSEIDIVVFERAVMNLREFDVVFVKKDYDQTPVRITTIPMNKLDAIKLWLHEMKAIWYTCAMNMQWPIVMREINKDLNAFVENGGWDAWFGGGDSDSEESGKNDGGSEESDFKGDSSDGSDEEGGGDDGDSDFSAVPDDESEEPDEDDDDESGMSWDELEKQADRSDKKRAEPDPPDRAPAKRTRRG